MKKRRTAAGVRGSSGAGAGAFFEGFRGMLAGYADGVHRVGPPATAAALADAAERLGAPLPGALASFLASWNGAELFHEAVVIHGAGAGAVGGDLVVRTLDLRTDLPEIAPELAAIGESADGLTYLAAPDGAVLLLEDEELWPAGTSFERWLDAVAAREALLVDREGEFKEGSFEGAEGQLRPEVAVQQARRAVKLDPGSARWRFELGLALDSVGKTAEALEALRAAAELHPRGAFIHHWIGRLETVRGELAAAGSAYEQAATVQPGHPSAAFFLLEAARVAGRVGAAERRVALGKRALEVDPGLVRQLREAAAHQASEGLVAEARELAELALEAAPRDLELLALLRSLEAR